MPDDNSNIVKIRIQGYDLPVIYRNLILTQSVCAHHEFSFVWNAGNFKSDTNFQLKILKTFIGSSINICFNDKEFNGLITEISVDDRSSNSQSFIIKGYSPTILTDDVPRSSSYYKKKLADIVSKILESVPENAISKSIDPVYTEQLHYTSQYNETDFEFLCRLAIRYGEWFYYDGTKLVFGKPGDSGAKLKAGSDLDRIVLQANLQPSKYNFKSYDAHKGEPVSKNLATLNKDIKNDFSTTATTNSLNTYSIADDRVMHTFNVVNKEQIEALTKTEESAINARMLTVKGESKNTELLAGCKFDVETRDGSYDYIITRVSHYSNIMGHYQNTFIAVPATVKVPPYTNPHVFRKADTQTAMVKENHDSDGIGRVKVQFHWQSGSDMSPWLRVSTPHAGGGKGMHFIPEKDEEVIVDFEGGDVEKPFILGSMFNGKAKSGRGDGDNNVKGLQTRSGNKVELDDKAGSVFVCDKTGNNKMLIDGNGKIAIDSTDSITLTSGTSIKFICGDSAMELKSDGTIEITGKKTVKILGADESVTVHSNKLVELRGIERTSLRSITKVDIKAPTTEIKGEINLKMESVAVQIEGSATTDIKGGIVQLNCG